MSYNKHQKVYTITNYCYIPVLCNTSLVFNCLRTCSRARHHKETDQRKRRLCMYVGVEENSVCFWLVAEGNEAWSEITQKSYVWDYLHEWSRTRRHSPQLFYVFMADRESVGGREEKKENMRERQMTKVFDMAMHYFFMGSLLYT